MLRFAEISLFLTPFALYLAWRVLGARATTGLLWTAAAVIVVLAATMIWYGMEHSLPAGTPYEPAQLRDGVVVPGHER
jgi:hypothetical protein